MKNFYMKYKNLIGIILDITIVILGLYTKNYIFVAVGIVLFFLTLYVNKLEKDNAKEQTRIAEEKRAIKAEQKRLNKGKKKKKKKKR